MEFSIISVLVNGIQQWRFSRYDDRH